MRCGNVIGGTVAATPSEEGHCNTGAVEAMAHNSRCRPVGEPSAVTVTKKLIGHNRDLEPGRVMMRPLPEAGGTVAASVC
jgi:hypothetical protein